MVDIVILHRNRLPYLKRTLKYIWERTKTPYRITIVDNGSKDREYIINLLLADKIYSLSLFSEDVNTHTVFNRAVEMATTEPFVLMHNDVLVPDVEPDWLSRLLAEFDWCEELGMLALNNPTCDNGDKTTETEKIQFVKHVVGYVAMYDQDIIPRFNVGSDVVDNTMYLASQIHLKGRRVGYLKDTYCKHIGKITSYKDLYVNNKFDPRTFIKTDPKTLRPL